MKLNTWLWAVSVCIGTGCGGDDDGGGGGDEDAAVSTDASAGIDAPPPDAAVAPTTLVAADRNGDIYLVDPTTGVDTLAINTMPAGAGVATEVGVVSAMLHIPSTNEWWLATGGNGDFCNGCILTLDPSTGAATILAANDGVVGENLGAIPGLAYDGVADGAFTTTADGSGELYALDADTGVASIIANGVNDGQSGKAMVLDGAGVLHVAGSDDLFTVDKVTGAAATVGAFTYTGFPVLADANPTIGSMTRRDSDGVVFGILMDGGGGGVTATYLATIDLTTAEVTNVGANTVILDGLAFVPTALLPQ